MTSDSAAPETQPTLADRALARLRKIASGNGIEPAAITVLQCSEQIFTLTGKMGVSPLCDSEPATYPGAAKAGRKMVATAAALQAAVAKHKTAFRDNPDWIAATVAEITSHDSQGWGLEDAKVTLPDKSAIYATTGPCPSCGGRQNLTCAQCNGQGSVTCTQCQGRGREPCYHCGGRGENPQQPGQPCLTCNGTRMAPCRFCQMHGHLPCPTCQGRRGTPCTTCQATGKITSEVAVTCGAETHFILQSGELPSGLRRGLERVGISNLGKGHADITASPVPQEEKDAAAGKAHIPILSYKVALPYAELRMGFGDKKAVVSAFGKRCAIMGAPPFLDGALQPWRDKLRRGMMEQAIEARALKEILSLTVAGKGRIEEVRRLYPFGLSAEAITSILADMQAALSKTTFKTRAIISAVCACLASALFYLLFDFGLEAIITGAWNPRVECAFDLAIPALALAASWAIVNFSTRFVLRRRFPQLTLSLKQKIGKTGYAMLAAITAAYILCVTLAPVRVWWLGMGR